MATDEASGRRRAALFDMDRTLVATDTASLYVRYRRDEGQAGVADVARTAWWLLQYTLGVIDAERVAERALRDYAGKREAWMEQTCRDWFRRYVLPHVSRLGREAVEHHRRAGDVLAIVTGATRYAAEPLARELGIEHVVCTELEVDADGCFTGRVVKPMCFGGGKIELTRRCADRHGFDLDGATFYSDSITDEPLLAHVARPVVVNPDTRLRRTAERRSWPIEHWR
jgi:HAD superfamily hydrolase (TIGR01490 family)